MARAQAFDTDTAMAAALETFWRRGYNGSSVQVLLDAMCLNRGSLYNSFGDKQALFRASLDLYRERVAEVVIQLLEQSPQPVQGILAVFELTLIGLPKAQRQMGCLLVNTVAELGETEPELARHALRLMQEVRAAFVAALQRAADTGLWAQPDPDPQVTADLLFNFMTGLRVTTRLQAQPAQIRRSVLKILGMLGLDPGEIST